MARDYHYDPLVVGPRPRHPPRRKLVILILVPQPPVFSKPKGVDAAALRQRRRVVCHALQATISIAASANSARLTSFGVLRARADHPPHILT